MRRRSTASITTTTPTTPRPLTLALPTPLLSTLPHTRRTRHSLSLNRRSRSGAITTFAIALLPAAPSTAAASPAAPAAPVVGLLAVLGSPPRLFLLHDAPALVVPPFLELLLLLNLVQATLGDRVADDILLGLLL